MGKSCSIHKFHIKPDNPNCEFTINIIRFHTYVATLFPSEFTAAELTKALPSLP
jgi:hypothetical protein